MNIKVFDKKDNENNSEYAYRLLRYNIMSLQILPGETINEGELAEILKVSRTPVHEAVLMLKKEALVEVYPQSKSKVSLIDMTIMKEGYFLRSIIEPEIIRRLSGNISQDKMTLLKENLDEQKRIIESGDIDRIDSFFKTDDKFHHIIYSAAEKNRIWYAMKSVSSHYDRVRYLDAIMGDADLSSIIKEHEKIYYFLLLGIPSDYNLELFYDNHLGSYRKKFQGLLEKYPTYFNLWGVAQND